MIDFRKEYKPLSDEQKSQMNIIKDEAQILSDVLDKCVPSDERSERGRMMNIARTNLEQAIMWAVKAVTG